MTIQNIVKMGPQISGVKGFKNYNKQCCNKKIDLENDKIEFKFHTLYQDKFQL